MRGVSDYCNNFFFAISVKAKVLVFAGANFSEAGSKSSFPMCLHFSGIVCETYLSRIVSDSVVYSILKYPESTYILFLKCSLLPKENVQDGPQ